MQIRPAVPTDALSVSRVHVRSWQTGYLGLLPQHYLDQLEPEQRAAKYDFCTTDPTKPHTLVAEEGGAIHGFATTMPSDDPNDSEVGELSALYVDPDWWNRKIGFALIVAARAHLAAHGARQAILWLLEGNLRGERFYRADGWTTNSLHRSQNVWGANVEEVQFHRSL